jgi:hypothetical protein
MKKVSSTLRDNLSFVPRPFALVDHRHNEYILRESAEPVDVTSPINFLGPVSGIDIPGVDTYIQAGEAVSALRILSSDGIKGVYSDPTSAESVRKIVGMSITAGATDSQIKMLSYGKYADSGWNLDPNLPIYLGNNGTITQVAPATGSVVLLGHVQSPTTIFLDIKQPITLA